MSEQTNPPLSPDTQAMLDCLRQAVSKTLERKRRLGQYSVQSCRWAECNEAQHYELRFDHGFLISITGC